VGAVSTTWVADDPTWSVLLQRDAVRKAGDALAVNTQDCSRITTPASKSSAARTRCP